ncbi:MAG TPA: AraC family transcriptional regulator [Pyrinomonadaceae bacterium]|nr:AraC family transcriptional regulator [Pyrinomonadaceae bacterium]
MCSKTKKDESKMWQSNEFGNLECLKADYVKHSFARHTHEGFAIGVVERGVEIFNYRGKQNRAGKGEIILINPGEVHDGNGEDKNGWAFRIFYADTKILQRAANEIAEKRVNLPTFRNPVVNNKSISNKLLRLHRKLEKSFSILERESLILTTFADLIRYEAEDAPTFSKHIGREPKAVSRAKTYLEENYMENVSLAELSAFSYLSQFHLIRVFKKYTGFSPHAYLEQIRINHAKELIKSGKSLIETTYELGFVDQSHLNKTFKKYAGTTPGQYSNGLQNSITH